MIGESIQDLFFCSYQLALSPYKMVSHHNIIMFSMVLICLYVKYNFLRTGDKMQMLCILQNYQE